MRGHKPLLLLKLYYPELCKLKSEKEKKFLLVVKAKLTKIVFETQSKNFNIKSIIEIV